MHFSINHLIPLQMPSLGIIIPTFQNRKRGLRDEHHCAHSTVPGSWIRCSSPALPEGSETLGSLSHSGLNWSTKLQAFLLTSLRGVWNLDPREPDLEPGTPQSSGPPQPQFSKSNRQIYLLGACSQPGLPQRALDDMTLMLWQEFFFF